MSTQTTGSREAASRLREWVERGRRGTPSITLEIPWRETPSLKGDCLISGFSRSFFMSAPADPVALYCDLLRIARKDISAIWRDELTLRIDGRAHAFPVDVRNNQFVAADRRCDLFWPCYEPDVVALMDLLVPDDGCLLDVGANWGYFSLHLAARQGFVGRILGYEPSGARVAEFDQLVRGFGLQHRIEIVPVALSDRSGTATLSDEVWTGTAQVYAAGAAAGEQIRLEPLDTLGAPPAQLVKVDVEHHEAAALRGAQQYVAAHRPWVIFERHSAVSKEEFAEPFHVLEEVGYSFALPATTIKKTPAGQPEAIILTLARTPIPEPQDFPPFANVVGMPPTAGPTPRSRRKSPEKPATTQNEIAVSRHLGRDSQGLEGSDGSIL